MLSVLAAAVPAGVVDAAENVALDNILMSRINGITTMQIWPACRMRYIDHTPVDAGIELRIRVAAGSDCAGLLDDLRRETYLPIGRSIGKIDDVTVHALSATDAFIHVRFTEPQKYRVRQRAVGWIEVFVDRLADSASLPAAVPGPLVDATPASPPAPLANRRPVEDRTAAVAPPSRQSVPASRVNVPPSNVGGLVVQLGVFESPDPAIQALLQTATPHFAYATEFEVNEKTWHGLQVGFFDSEADAEQVLRNLQPSFPDAWVRYVAPAEAELARAGGDLRDNDEGQMQAVRTNADASVDEDELRQSMARALDAMLARRYGEAIRHYSNVLAAPGHEHRQQAREYLGVAFERNGQLDNATAEYRAYLAEFSGDDGASRVAERLRTLETAAGLTARPLATPINRTVASASPRWEIMGGIAQNYWRNQEQLVHDGNHVVSTSGVLATSDVVARRRGERFDVLMRFNGAYQFNLVDFDDTGDVAWVSRAFIDVVDTRLGLNGRVGRQTRRDDGMIGRFDGVSVGYRWRPDITFALSGGAPLDSPRYTTDTDRLAIGASARIDDLWDRLSVSAFFNQQNADGLLDRQAVGGDVAYRNGPLSVVGMIDFDVSYNVLNTALVNASMLLDNGWRLNTRVDFGVQPFLTTRNALAGQSTTSIDDLLLIYTEGQVRRLARDRTAQSTALSAGMSLPLGERYELSFDVAMRQADATVASGGVVAIPETGNQVFATATLVGTSVLRENDLTIVSLRYDATRTWDTSMLLLDARIPFGKALRISPRVTVTNRTAKLSDETQLVIAPALRGMLRWGNFLVDLEMGARWSSRELSATELDPFTEDGVEEVTGGFVNLGYRWEF